MKQQGSDEIILLTGPINNTQPSKGVSLMVPEQIITKSTPTTSHWSTDEHDAIKMLLEMGVCHKRQ